MNPADSHCVTLGKSFHCLGISHFLDYCEEINDHPIFKCILKNIKKVTTWQVGPGSVIYGERQRRQEAKCLWCWKKDHGNLCLLNMSKVLSHCSRLLWFPRVTSFNSRMPWEAVWSNAFAIRQTGVETPSMQSQGQVTYPLWSYPICMRR